MNSLTVANMPSPMRNRGLREAFRRDPVRWAESNYYIEDTERPIVLQPHQKAFLRYCFTRDENGRFPFRTILYSAPKKSGKTAIAGLIVQWCAEYWQRYGEILCIGNDADQAKGRAFKAVATSVELTPGYDRSRQELPGKWRLGSKFMECIPSGTTIKAVATDYKGEAGGNPILTSWTELWGYTQSADMKMWAEMAPSPTRLNSIRFIDTYAGYEGESELLWNLYDNVVLQGHQLTVEELGAGGCYDEAPNPDSLTPCYENKPAGLFAYWDSGEQARRMPWQRGPAFASYLAEEEATQTPPQFTRLHLNQWSGAESEFVPIEWWDACNNPLLITPGDRTPLVVGIDAATSNDCFGIVVVSRDPDQLDPPGVVLRMSRKWNPPPRKGGTIDFAGPEAYLRWLAENFNIVQFAYDPYQLHDMCTRLGQAGVGWFRAFGQVQERLFADKSFRDLILHRRWRHDGDLEVRTHINNANAKHYPNEDSKLRIVKKSETRKIDLAVCCSMAAAECLRLDL